MATPDTSLGTKLYNAATLSNFGTLASIGFGIYGTIEDNKKWAGVNRKLDDLLKGQELIISKIDKVYGEVKESDLKNILLEYENAINEWYHTYSSLGKRATKAGENQALLKRDTETLIKKLEDCGTYLGLVHDAFLGEFRTLDKAYMEAYAEIILAGGKAETQSQYFHALARFERWLILQQKGFLLMGNYLKYRSPEANLRQILRDMQYVTHYSDDTDKQILKMKQQAEYSAQFVAKLNQYTQKRNTGTKQDSDFLAFGINSCDASDICYLDTHSVESDPGKIVVGLQLYRKFDWLAIKIIQAVFSNGCVDQKNAEPKANDHTSSSGVPELINKERLKKLVKENGRKQYKVTEYQVLKHQQIYIDLSSPEAPSREVMTGAKLFLRGNWICLGIQAAKLNSTLTEIDESSRHWIDAPGPVGKPTDDVHFFTIRGTAKYINILPLTPTPLAPLRGVKFWRDFNGDAHFVNLSVKTGLCDIEDLWRKYDISMLTSPSSAALLLDGKYTGKVILKDSQGLNIDGVGWAGMSSSVLDLTHTAEKRIRFEYASQGGRQSVPLGGGKDAFYEFEWSPMPDGSITLRAKNGKFLGRKVDQQNAFFVADQASEQTAERFQIVPVED